MKSTLIKSWNSIVLRTSSIRTRNDHVLWQETKTFLQLWDSGAKKGSQRSIVGVTISFQKGDIEPSGVSSISGVLWLNSWAVYPLSKFVHWGDFPCQLTSRFTMPIYIRGINVFPDLWTWYLAQYRLWRCYHLQTS